MKPASQFDSFAQSYERDLDQALSITGDDKEYFARARIQWLAKRLRELGAAPRAAMDYDGASGMVPGWCAICSAFSRLLV